MERRIAVAVVAAVLLSACSSAPPTPQRGTPAFYWSAAKETFATGDFLKTSDHLEQIGRSENEFSARALPWRLVITSGLAGGFADLADSFEAGARVNKTNSTPFRRHVSEFRSRADRQALQFAETFQGFLKSSKDDKVTLAFAYPSGSLTPVAQLSKASTGILLAPPDLEDAQKRALERAIVRTTCLAVGAPEDTAKAQALFKAGSVEIPRAAFVTTMAGALHEEARIYAPGKLDQPDRLKTFCNLALEALKSVPASAESKALMTKIQATLKRSKT